MDQIKDIFYIVDEPYSRNVGRDGKPWYGKLIKRNAKRLFKEDIVKIDKWVNLIFDCVMSIMSPIKVIDNLSDTRNHLHLDGANLCCITLILYLIDRPNYSIWFQAQHKELQKLYPKIGRFSRSGKIHRV